MRLDETFLKMACLLANHSKCKKRKVGALLVLNGRIIAGGYNGTLPHAPNECECNGKTISSVVHAEQNTIAFCANKGISMHDTTMYITCAPCIDCAKLMASSGVTKVVYISDNKQDGIDLLVDYGIEVKQIKDI